MVKVELTKQNGQFLELKMSGHANGGDYGHDLVCAALTGIMSGALNAYDAEYRDDVILMVKDNSISIKVKNLANKDVQKTFGFLVYQIKTILVQYPQNVTLKEVG
ncbi:hypothetical protein LD125_00574 [Mesoplasma sp. JKS002658]|uniref:ribosomal-processing cysteine protease Prp n=1 Tax=Mesoplasma whartonense TaxID=2878854 RepID=UPI002022A281|nr:MULTISPECIES: ribosomal-processing cysteine protease Prp [unclassified Mesoplasma]MCL8211308.1 hypothetical protein [Mesoplasma sp. JKS002664]MCL8212161.1 hypothetical protein [Mesoplasma sp. JKS002662]MCL8212575.1 hypothetical protein [Mesoplasma sp. JKS002661]MCL8214310.1 hypothetical protein [Mesoplasma sp. JKS002658]MCL8214646.1 hypothetical protein [Mesoplasma sp. JKS002663]